MSDNIEQDVWQVNLALAGANQRQAQIIAKLREQLRVTRVQLENALKPERDAVDL